MTPRYFFLACGLVLLALVTGGVSGEKAENSAKPSESKIDIEKIARWIARWEGFYSCVYNDPAGHATIGYGHLIHLGYATEQDQKEWGCINKKEAQKLLRQDLLRGGYYDAATRFNNLDQRRATALVSFFYNVGPGVLEQDRGIYTSLRKSRWSDLAAEIGEYIYATTPEGEAIQLPGLLRRRSAEARLLR